MNNRQTYKRKSSLRARIIAEPLERRVLLAASYTPVVQYQFSGPGASAFSVHAGGADGQYVGITQPSAPRQALLWSGSGTPTVMNITGWSSATVDATDGTYQVGEGVIPGGKEFTDESALLWHGAGSAPVNLNPGGFSFSSAFGVGGGEEVGDGNTTDNSYQGALLWHGTPQSAVLLNPAGFQFSTAWATDGIHQVGDGQLSSVVYRPRALLWSGTAASAIDLNPSGFNDSRASAVSGNQQVGLAYNMINGSVGPQSAFLWTGTAASAIDLNPAGYAQSGANWTNGSQQLGWAIDPSGVQHLVVWSGSAASAVILPDPPLQFDGIDASYIDSSGNIYGVAYRNVGSYFYNYWAIEWKAPSQISASGNALSTTEGVPVSGVLATFTDSVPNDLANLTATVNWSDGTSGPGKITFDSTTGQYQVTGGHTYVLAGTYQATVAISDTSGNKDSAIATINVADAPLSAFSVTLNGVATIAFSGAVGSFTDSDPNARLSYYTSTINWGDGQTSGGVVSFNPGTKRFDVSGGHTYASGGTYALSVVISDIGGGGTTISSTAAILPPGPTPQISGASTVNEGSNYTLALSAGDTLGFAIKNWQLNWGDGSIEQVAGSATIASHVFDDGPASELITATATDEKGYAAATTLGVMVNDVAPTAVFSAAAPTTPGGPGTARFSSAFDPSNADTIAGFRYSFDWEDNGVFEVVNSLVPTAPIPANYLSTPGAHVIHGRIADKDGLFTDDTATINVAAAGNSSPSVSAFSRIAIAEADSSIGFPASGGQGGLLEPGDWLSFAVNFGTGVSKAKMQLSAAAAKAGLRVQLRLDDPTGQVVASFSKRALASHGQTARAAAVTGVHNLYLEVVGGQAQVNWFSFAPIVAKRKLGHRR